MKQDWREKAVVKRLRKLHKMTKKQISGIIWLWTQASRVQLPSSQGSTVQKSLRRAVQVPPAKNFTLQFVSQNFRKSISNSHPLQTFDITI